MELNAVTLDHGILLGLLDDDHTQYLLRADLAVTAPITLAGSTIGLDLSFNYNWTGLHTHSELFTVNNSVVVNGVDGSIVIRDAPSVLDVIGGDGVDGLGTATGDGASGKLYAGDGGIDFFFTNPGGDGGNWLIRSGLHGAGSVDGADGIIYIQDQEPGTGKQVYFFREPLAGIDTSFSEIHYGTVGFEKFVTFKADVFVTDFFDVTVPTAATAPATITVTSTEDDRDLVALVIQQTTTADMIDGFGSVILFQATDSGGTFNQGLIAVKRDGGDDLAKLELRFSGKIFTIDSAGTDLNGTYTGDGLVIAGTSQLGDGGSTNYTEISATGDILPKGSAFIVIEKASGNGIKVDHSTPTFGFADIIGDQFSRNTGATKPTLATYNGVVRAWQFGNGDEANLSFHIPHDYVAGTDIHLHIHWSQTSATNTGGDIDFRYTAIYAKGHNQASGSTFTSTPKTALFTSITLTGAGSNQYQQHLTEVTISAATATAALFDRDDFEPDGVIELTFEMDANNLTDSGGVLDPFVHFVDIHYQTTSVTGTKSRTPDFYA